MTMFVKSNKAMHTSFKFVEHGFQPKFYIELASKDVTTKTPSDKRYTNSQSVQFPSDSSSEFPRCAFHKKVYFSHPGLGSRSRMKIEDTTKKPNKPAAAA